MREIVKERSIYTRESAVGMSPGAYLAAKVLVLGLLTAVQASAFTFLSILGRDAPDDALVVGWSADVEILIAVVAVALASMLIGLLISVVIDNADRGMPLLILAIMIQLIFCGGLFPVHDRLVLEQISWLVPAHWGFSMAAATADLSVLSVQVPDPSWSHDAAVWYGNFARLIVISLLVYGAILVVLKRSDPQRKTR